MLGLLVFIAHYLKYRQFGLYEDDYVVSAGMSFSWPAIKTNLINCFTSFERPIGFFTIVFLPYLGAKVGGLEFLHLMGFSIVWLNTVLVYILIRQGFSQKSAFIGAVTFALFPADTTKGLLIHAFHLQPSLTYLLLSCILYLRNKKALSYAVIILPLLTYESAILPFFAVPLLAYNWDRAIIKKIALHILIMAAILTAYTAIRMCVGEGRLAEAASDPARTIAKAAASMILGPVCSGLLFVIRPVTGLIEFCRTDISDYFSKGYYSLIAVLAVLSWGLLRSDNGDAPKRTLYRLSSGALKMNLSMEPAESTVKLCKLVVAGMAVIVISYGLSFVHFPPIAIRGRATSVHLAATLGWSFFCAGSFGLFLLMGEILNKKSMATAILSVYFLLLAIFQLKVQGDYVKSWDIQKRFYREVISLCPDISEKTIIFFDKGSLRETEYIQTFSWAVPVVLEQIFSFPPEWERPPRAFPEPVEAGIKIGKGDIKWYVPTARWRAYWDTLALTNTIFVQFQNNKWLRKDRMIFSGRSFPVKRIHKGDRSRQFDKGPLYKYLFEN